MFGILVTGKSKKNRDQLARYLFSKKFKPHVFCPLTLQPF